MSLEVVQIAHPIRVSPPLLDLSQCLEGFARLHRIEPGPLDLPQAPVLSLGERNEAALNFDDAKVHAIVERVPGLRIPKQPRGKISAGERHGAIAGGNRLGSRDLVAIGVARHIRDLHLVEIFVQRMLASWLQVLKQGLKSRLVALRISGIFAKLARCSSVGGWPGWKPVKSLRRSSGQIRCASVILSCHREKRPTTTSIAV